MQNEVVLVRIDSIPNAHQLDANKCNGFVEIKIMSSNSWKNRAKRFLQDQPQLLRFYYWLRPPKQATHNHLLLRYAVLKEPGPVYFAQVGAHAGGLHDPLDRHLRLSAWQGLFVEPQLEELEALKMAYRKFPGLHFENVAVDRQAGTRTFYQITPDKRLPAWISQLSSFHARVPQLILKDHPEAAIISREVQCVPLETLLEQHQFKKLNVLITDTEGHDFEVLKSFDLERWRPDIILYEHYHLQQDDRQALTNYLQSAGYYLWPNQANTLAVRSQEWIQSYPGVWMSGL